jgi:hypothetical protein
VRVRAGLDPWTASDLVVELPDDGYVDWELGRAYPEDGIEYEDTPVGACEFEVLPAAAAKASAYRSWKSQLKKHLYKASTVNVWYCRMLKKGSAPGQSEAEFRAQLRHGINELRDEQLDKLRQKYAAKMDRIEERIRKAEQRIDREQQQYASAKVSTAVSFGATVLGALFGRRSAITKAGSTIRGVGRSSQQRGDVTRAKADLRSRQQDLFDLEAELQDEIEQLEDEFDPHEVALEELVIAPRKADITITRMLILWQPYAIPASGRAYPLF